MEAALPAGLVLAALGAALIGAFVVRLSGIYLAMMTLAAAQILYAVAFQWVPVTGGDNGIVGVWPSSWVAGRSAYYWLTLALTALTVLVLKQVIDIAVRLQPAGGARFRSAGGSHRPCDPPAALARLRDRGSRRRNGRKPLCVFPGLGRPELAGHSNLRGCADDAAAWRNPDYRGTACQVRRCFTFCATSSCL